MELNLKPISQGGIAEAISKIELYRYLNQSEEAESICQDILAVEPENQMALRMLGLVLTDQFTGDVTDRYADAEKIFQSLTDPYERLYYTGLLHERRAKAQLRAGHLPHTLLPLFEEALRCYEEAEKIRPPDNDDAILRWNRCVRLLQSNPDFHLERETLAFESGDSPPDIGAAPSSVKKPRKGFFAR